MAHSRDHATLIVLNIVYGNGIRRARALAGTLSKGMKVLGATGVGRVLD